MKTIKYTAVALAMIAAASFTSTAKAASTGDIILGVYDSSATITTDYVVDLGSYSSLTAGETFNLGSELNTLFGSSTTLQFDIAGAGGSSSSGGGLSTKQFAYAATDANEAQVQFSGSNTTPTGALSNIYSGLGQTGTNQTALVTTGTNFKAYTQPTSGFNNNFVTQSGDLGANPGFGTGNVLSTAYSTTASASFYTLANGSTTPVADPKGITGGDEFVFGGTANAVTLTFDPVAAPEPSAYALGLCAAALFWVLNRRRSVA